MKCIFQDPRPGPCICSPHSAVQFLLGSRVQVYLGATVVLSSPKPSLLVWKPSLGLCSPLVILQGGPCSQFPLIFPSLPPSPATVSGTNSSNTVRLVRIPRPQHNGILPRCLRSCCFFELERFSLLPLPCLPGKHLFISRNPTQRPPPPGGQPHALPPPGYLCTL